ncbi:Uncharacterized protein C18orf63 [Dufourea novaeangliae]|uniref:Uncharacterized protein C18orf63 n=1 Tax=Dufourea novaeangliae TaxID=178035 RepID=A0A154NZ35_DUFNO|nr:Uncharacterized protein C18orf63 [Dufourea novaeangliae]
MDISSVAYERKENTILYASFPQINELYCIFCEIDFIEVHESSAKSNFHWQTMKCRLLIHLISDIIASPILGTERYIFIITHKAFFESGKLERILKYLKLVYQGTRPVTVEVYKTCLLYTIQSKIAPLWNKVGQYFLQGKQFYNSVEPIPALKLDVLLEEKNMSLQLYAEKVNVPYIKLEDYIPSFVLSQFLADPKGYIDLSHYKLPFVYVLPSTKKGKLLSVSKEVPTRSLFKDYDQLRRHWKNMYGYSLPKNKNGILYFEIKFLIPRSNIFTYPNLCVASGPIDIIPSRGKEIIITQFISDMLAKIPTICGKELQIFKHAFHNTEIPIAHIPSGPLFQNKELNIPLKRKCDSISTVPLEFSARYAEELRENPNIASKSIKTQLARIHKIHNTFVSDSNIADLSSKNIRENENEVQSSNTMQMSAIENTKHDFNEASTSRNSNVNVTITKDETISKYFKICKPQFAINTKELVPDGIQKDFTLKEKLLKAKSNEKEKMSTQVTNQDIDVETMAKNNNLHEVTNTVLSNWLKAHSIPHDSRGAKTHLINKVKSHLRNTQVLKQFRM